MDEHGRIGYGRYARYTPALIALVIIAALVVIGAWQRRPGSESAGAGRLVGRAAPPFTLTLLDGTTLRLADLRGKVVVLNFWASWCAPCERELPRFQALNDAWSHTGEPVQVVGIGVKRDYGDGARALVQRLGLTFPIGRDTAGSDELIGPIQHAYGVSTLPTTVFIRPDGTVAAVHIGELSAELLRQYVAASLVNT
ncbi:MAG: hypothetical protein C4346_06050 [Chloroflexota bacterium]